MSENGSNVTATDITDAFVRIASKTAPKAKVLQMDMRKLTFPDKSFDGLWCSAALLHLPKNQAKPTLEGFARVLKNSGIFYLGLKVGVGETFVQKSGRNDKYSGYYLPDELTSLLEDCGFQILDMEQKRSNGVEWINIFARKTEL